MFKHLLCLISFLFSCLAQKEITDQLNYGLYPVGFKLFHVYDKSRSYFAKYDYFQQMTENPAGRPMQISMWYPAASIAGLKPLKYRQYIGFESSETDFSKQNIQYQTQTIEETIQSVLPAYQEKLRTMLNQDLDVYKDAETVAGDFPLVLYSPPQGTSAYDNHLICEFLASKGYLVLAVAAKGEYGRLQKSSIRSIYTQADDLAFLLQFGRDYTQSKKVATIGFSRGGLANIVFAMKNKDIDATISLDGSIMSQGWLQDIAVSPYYQPESFTSDLLIITKNMAVPKLNPSTFYDQVQYADKTLIRYDHDQHGYFSAYNLIFELLFDKQMTADQKTPYFHFFAEMTRYVGEFLDHKLKSGLPFKVHQKKAYEHSFESKQSTKQAINPASLSTLLIEHNYAYVKAILDDIQNYEPDFLGKVNWRDLHFAAEKTKQCDDAINILHLADQAFPNWYLTHYKLASLYQNNNDTTRAIKHYRQALQDHPRHKPSQNALKILGAEQANYHENKLNDDQLEMYLGKYIVDDKRYRQIYKKEGKLYLESNYWERPLELWPISKERFIIVDDDPRFNQQILFQFDEHNRLVSLKTRGLNSGRIGAANLKIADD